MIFIQSQNSYFWTTNGPSKQIFFFKYQQIKNTWTERTKYFAYPKKPPVRLIKLILCILTGWHLLLVISWVAGWISGATISIQRRWGERTGGAPHLRIEWRRIQSLKSINSFLVLVSVTVRVIIRQCPCTVCERHLAFFCRRRRRCCREVDIGTLARCSAPPEGPAWVYKVGKCGSRRNHSRWSVFT